MLVNAKEMLEKAYKDGYGIGQFNINNLEWTKAILEACEEKNTAVILGVSEGAKKYMGGFNVVAQMVKAMDKDLGITVPVALHLDHGSYEGAKEAIEAGFTSVMFDGSSLPIEENLEKTKEIVELAHSKNISVEAEVGGIGGEEDGVASEGELADPQECKKIVDLGIDFLAAGIGNIHGVYPEDWKGLNFERLEEIKEAIGEVPMVLHGGTGIPEEQVKKAIELGVSKININTECQIAFTEATRKYFEEGKDKVGKGFDPRKVLKPGYEAIKETVREKVDFFDGENSADK
ncbi:MAG: class II fructose-1,6-bisphosphate aldolase [Anaerococcus sp.]|jgi:fructose-bisphosphate aldolase class II|nr:class II fructose-1,6-bisphosphate aldolase [Peptoniphilaceae bacterium]MDY3055289.1 class II fructose-1,6-bisphosphate aldolase [Anaerococcus sp.]